MYIIWMFYYHFPLLPPAEQSNCIKEKKIKNLKLKEKKLRHRAKPNSFSHSTHATLINVFGVVLYGVVLWISFSFLELRGRLDLKHYKHTPNR